MVAKCGKPGGGVPEKNLQMLMPCERSVLSAVFY